MAHVTHMARHQLPNCAQETSVPCIVDLSDAPKHCNIALWVCRPNLEERRKLARIVHSWRVTYAAHQLVNQLPPHFSFFQQQLGLKPLLLTPQGYVVLLLKVRAGKVGCTCVEALGRRAAMCMSCVQRAALACAVQVLEFCMLSLLQVPLTTSQLKIRGCLACNTGMRFRSKCSCRHSSLFLPADAHRGAGVAFAGGGWPACI
eukprot:GHRQ01015178.1.p1 GENE.GHRQ01015178.1~~GHRQ01015178.1.p1  ORF type:complete len:203 (+),score=47.61 GHRQ01015178.1:400-1008(+)